LDIHGSFSNLFKLSHSESFSKHLVTDPGLVATSGMLFSSLKNQNRFFTKVAAPYAVLGGGIALTYQLILDFLNHHETNADKPSWINHLIATSLIGTVSGGVFGGRPKMALVGFMTSTLIVFPMAMWGLR